MSSRRPAAPIPPARRVSLSMRQRARRQSRSAAVSDQLPAAGAGPADPASAQAAGQASDAGGAAAPPAQAAAGQPPAAANGDRPARRRWLTGGEIIQALTHGSSAVITTLAIFLALIAGGLLIVFSDPNVL